MGDWKIAMEVKYNKGILSVKVPKVLGFVLSFLMLAGFAGAYIFSESAVYTQHKPSNQFISANGTYMNFTGTGSVPPINITTNFSWEQQLVDRGQFNITMFASLYNGSHIINETSYVLINDTTIGTQNNSHNSSSWPGYNLKPQGDGINFIRIVFRFSDNGTAGGNLTWSNASGGLNGVYITNVIEWGPNRINISNDANAAITNRSILGAASGNLALNISTNVTAANCFAQIGLSDTGASIFTQDQLVNRSGGRTGFQNATRMGFNDTQPGVFNNLTYYCRDAYGNTSYFNTSVNLSTTNMIFFQVDTQTPVIINESYFVENTTAFRNSPGNILVTRLTVFDNNPHACGVRINIEGYTNNITNITSILHTPGMATSNLTQCSINITPGFFTPFGAGANITIERYANDSVTGRAITTNTSFATNYKGVAIYLRKGWNAIGLFQNLTLNGTAGITKNISQVAMFMGTGNKTFMIHTVGLAGFQGLQSYAGWNATYVNSEVDQVILVNHSVLTKEMANVSVRSNGPNLVTMLRNNMTVNDTLNIILFNESWNNSRILFNITGVSVFMPTAGANGKWCGAVPDIATTSCGRAYTVTNTTISMGQAFWVHVNANGTINTTINT